MECRSDAADHYCAGHRKAKSISEQILPLSALPIRSNSGIFVPSDCGFFRPYIQMKIAEYTVNTTITAQNLRCQRGSAR